MLKWIKRFRAFIITFILGLILSLAAIILSFDAFIGGSNLLGTIADVLSCVLELPFAIIPDHFHADDSIVGIGVLVDVFTYSLLVQYLWNRRKRNISQPKSQP